MRFIAKIPTLIVLSLIMLVTFSTVGFAAETVAPADSSSLLDLFKPVYNAFSGGHYAYAGALLVILMVALTKRYLGNTLPWLHTDAGGSTLALAAAGATAMAAALAAPGATVTLGLLKTALLVGVGAAGGFAMLKNLIIEPLLKPLEAKAPLWAKPIFALVFWIFDKPDPIATAEAAGTKAVTDAPAAGTASVIGKPTDVA